MQVDSIGSYDMASFSQGDYNVSDSSSHNRDLLVYGTPNVDSVTKSIIFDGNNDYMKYLNIGNTAGAWSHSIAFWIYVDSQILSQSSGYQETVFFIGQQDTLKSVVFKYHKPDAQTVEFQYSFWWHDTEMELGSEYFDSWQHVVLTYDSQKNFKKVYHNGVLSNTTLRTWSEHGTSESSVLNLDVSQPIDICRDPRNMRYFNGKLRQFQMFDRVLTPREVYVASLYPVEGLNNAILDVPMNFSVVYNKENQTFTPTLNTVLYENLEEHSNLDMTITITSKAGHTKSVTKSFYTGFDLPTLSISNTSMSTDGAVRVYSTVSAFDKTSTVTVYYAVFLQQHTKEELKTFFIDNERGTVLLHKGVHDTNHSLSISDFTKYYQTIDHTTASDMNIYNTTYYLHVYLVDDRKFDTSVVSNAMTINILANNFGTKTTTTNNTRSNAMLKHGDSVTLTWETSYVSNASDFTASIFGLSVTPTSSDGVNWTATKALPSNWTTNRTLSDAQFFSVSYFTTPITFPNLICINLTTPEMNLTIANTNRTGNTSNSSTSITFINLDSLKTSENPKGNDYSGYTFDFTATQVSIDEVKRTVINNVYPTTDAVINGLTGGNIYDIQVNVTDAAGNQYTSTVFSLQTKIPDNSSPTADLTIKTPKAPPTLGYDINGYVYFTAGEIDAYAFMSDSATGYTDAQYTALFTANPSFKLTNYNSLNAFSNKTQSTSMFNTSSLSFTQYYDGTEFKDFLTERQYYVHVVAEILNVGTTQVEGIENDWFPTVHNVPKIPQTITVDSFTTTNTHHNKVGTHGDTINLLFSTAYPEIQTRIVYNLGVSDSHNVRLFNLNDDSMTWKITYDIDSGVALTESDPTTVTEIVTQSSATVTLSGPDAPVLLDITNGLTNVVFNSGANTEYLYETDQTPILSNSVTKSVGSLVKTLFQLKEWNGSSSDTEHNNFTITVDEQCEIIIGTGLTGEVRFNQAKSILKLFFNVTDADIVTHSGYGYMRESNNGTMHGPATWFGCAVAPGTYTSPAGQFGENWNWMMMGISHATATVVTETQEDGTIVETVKDATGNVISTNTIESTTYKYIDSVTGEEVPISFTLDVNDTLTNISIPSLQSKSLYFEPGNTVSLTTSSAMDFPTNPFAISYWVKFDPVLGDWTNVMMGSSLGLMPYAINETEASLVMRGYATTADERTYGGSFNTYDRTINKDEWIHICRTFRPPNAGLGFGSMTYAWQQAYYVNGVQIFNVSLPPDQVRGSEYFNENHHTFTGQGTMRVSSDSWTFDFYWNYMQGRSQEGQNTFLASQLRHAAIWLNTDITKTTVEMLYNAGPGYIPIPPTITATEFKYTFEVSVLTGNNANWLIPGHILADGVALFENSNFDRLETLVVPLSEADIHTKDMNHLIDSDPSSYVNWRENPQPVGTKLFNLYFKERVQNITIYYARPRYAPGWKIYENDVVVYTDTSNHGNSLEPSPYTVTYFFNTKSVYDNATHYYPFGDKKLKDVNGGNDLVFFNVNSAGDNFDFITDGSVPSKVSFPMTQPSMTIPEILDSNGNVVYTNVSVDANGNVTDYTAPLQELSNIDIEILDPSAFSYTSTTQARSKMLPITESTIYYYLTQDPNSTGEYNDAWRLVGDLTDTFTYYARLDSYTYDWKANPNSGINNYEFTFTLPTYVYMGFETNDWDYQKTRFITWLNEWFGSSIVGTILEDLSHTKGQRYIRENLDRDGEINWVYALIKPGTYNYTLDHNNNYLATTAGDYAPISPFMICIGKSVITETDLTGSRIATSIGKPEIYINAHTNQKNGYTIPHDVITVDGISCWNCGENWNTSDGGIYNLNTPIVLTGASMTISFWAKSYASDNNLMYASTADGLQVRFMFRYRNTTEYTRSVHYGLASQLTPTATQNEWEFVTMVFNGNQLTSYIVPFDYDITQGLVENTHYRTETMDGTFGNAPITHIVGHPTELYRNNRLYLANTFAWNKQLTLEEVQSLYEITKPNYTPAVASNEVSWSYPVPTEPKVLHLNPYYMVSNLTRAPSTDWQSGNFSFMVWYRLSIGNIYNTNQAYNGHHKYGFSTGNYTDVRIDRAGPGTTLQGTGGRTHNYTVVMNEQFYKSWGAGYETRGNQTPSSELLDNNQWICAVYTVGSNGYTTRHYHNAVKKSDRSGSPSHWIGTLYTNNSGNGWYLFGSPAPIHGAYSHVSNCAWWKRQLSDTDVTTLFRHGAEGGYKDYTNPVLADATHHWTFNETLTDSKGGIDFALPDTLPWDANRKLIRLPYDEQSSDGQVVVFDNMHSIKYLTTETTTHGSTLYWPYDHFVSCSPGNVNGPAHCYDTRYWISEIGTANTTVHTYTNNTYQYFEGYFVGRGKPCEMSIELKEDRLVAFTYRVGDTNSEGELANLRTELLAKTGVDAVHDVDTPIVAFVRRNETIAWENKTPRGNEISNDGQYKFLVVLLPAGTHTFTSSPNLMSNGLFLAKASISDIYSKNYQVDTTGEDLGGEEGLLRAFSTTYTDLNGGYSVRHLYDEYTGPHLRLKRSTDNAEQDFTFDKDGVSAEFESWVGSATATVVKWYDQSGNNNHGTAVGAITFQYNLKNLYFGSAAYFTLPDATIPYNDNPYTFILHHGQLDTSETQNGLLGSGTAGTNLKTNGFSRYHTTYRQYWWADPNTDGGTYRDNQVVVARYNGSSRNVFVPQDGNGAEKAVSGRSSTASNNFIGKNDTVNNHTLNGEMYTVMIFKSAVSYDNISGISQSLPLPEPRSWILLNRDVNTILKSGNIQNVGADGDVDNFNTSYSRLGDLLNGTGDMTDARIKSNGYYKFRLIPYISSNNTTRIDPNSDNTRYVEWTQTSNPTKTNDSVQGLANESHVGVQEGSTSQFAGLYIQTAYTNNTWLSGSTKTNWWYAVGAKANHGGEGTGPFAENTNWDLVTKTELWVYINNAPVTETDTTGEVSGGVLTKHLAFHYGVFDNKYEDGNVTNAANNFHLYENTPTGSYDWGTLTSVSTVNNQTIYNWIPNGPITTDVLLVAGGGAGGAGHHGGGGGAGGLSYHENVLLQNELIVKVGRGGTVDKNASDNSPGITNGYDSSFTGLPTSTGGGRGGAEYDGRIGKDGGSGGGGTSYVGSAGGNGINGQGNNGGAGTTGRISGGGNIGGGGGGAGVVGSDEVNGGHGGNGIDYSHIFGTFYGSQGWFSGGGGGGTLDTDGSNRSPGNGGHGGGGRGGKMFDYDGTSGVNHTGGGGGGEGKQGSRHPGSGGSGIVLVKAKYYPPPVTGYKYWRISFMAQSSGERWLGANRSFASYTDSHGMLLRHPNSMRIRSETSDISTLTKVPHSIDRSQIVNVDINRNGNKAFGGAHTSFTHDSIFYDPVYDTYLYVNSGIVVDGYNRVVTLDIEFASPTMINEFLFSGWTLRAALPYIVKIDYSDDGSNYTNDVQYIRNSSQTTNPVLNSFDTSATDIPHMILQRSTNGEWIDSISKKLDPPTIPYKLWRIRFSVYNTDHDLFDLEASTASGNPHGIYDANGNHLLANHNPNTNYVSLFDTVSNRYTVYSSSNQVISASGGNVHANWFNQGSSRMYLYAQQNAYILIGFENGLAGTQIDKIGFVTYAHGRPNRIPKEMKLEYYAGVLGDHDQSKWFTWATLNNSSTKNSPVFKNITEGATIVSSED